eukprot:2390697-Pyramimonas_sp.AAC.1
MKAVRWLRLHGGLPNRLGRSASPLPSVAFPAPGQVPPLRGQEGLPRAPQGTAVRNFQADLASLQQRVSRAGWPQSLRLAVALWRLLFIQ